MYSFIRQRLEGDPEKTLSESEVKGDSDVYKSYKCIPPPEKLQKSANVRL